MNGYDYEIPMNGEMPMNMGMPMKDKEREMPEFKLKQDELPELLTWKVGGKYYLVMKVEMTGLEKCDNEVGNDSSKMEAEFEVLSVRALGDKPLDAKSIEREDFNRLVAKVRSGEL